MCWLLCAAILLRQDVLVVDCAAILLSLDSRTPAPRLASVLDAPTRILHIDVSLNDLSFLHHDWLLPFRNLRALDASLNQIKQ